MHGAPFAMGWVGIVFVVLLVGLLVLLWLGPRRHRRSSPEEILKARYARGEIGTEEYEQMLGELRR